MFSPSIISAYSGGGGLGLQVERLDNSGESVCPDAKLDVSEYNNEFVLGAVDCLRLFQRLLLTMTPIVQKGMGKGENGSAQEVEVRVLER